MNRSANTSLSLPSGPEVSEGPAWEYRTAGLGSQPRLCGTLAIDLVVTHRDGAGAARVASLMDGQSTKGGPAFTSPDGWQSKDA